VGVCRHPLPSAHFRFLTMIASKDTFEPHSSEQLPNSRRVYVPGVLHPEVQVPMREISVGATQSRTGTETPN